MSTLHQFLKQSERAERAFKKSCYENLCGFSAADIHAIREKCFREVIAAEIAKERKARVRDSEVAFRLARDCERSLSENRLIRTGNNIRALIAKLGGMMGLDPGAGKTSERSSPLTPLPARQ